MIYLKVYIQMTKKNVFSKCVNSSDFGRWEKFLPIILTKLAKVSPGHLFRSQHKMAHG